MNPARYLPIIFALALVGRANATPLNNPDLTIQDCIDAGGSVEDSTLRCYYDFDDGVAFGKGVTGTTEVFYPSPPGDPREDLVCDVTCTTPGVLIPSDVECLANLSWTYIQGCPPTSEGDEVIRRTFEGEGDIYRNADWHRDTCTVLLGNLNTFCAANAEGPETTATPVNAFEDSKCCDIAGGPASPTPSESSTPEDSPVPQESPIDTFVPPEEFFAPSATPNDPDVSGDGTSSPTPPDDL